MLWSCSVEPADTVHGKAALEFARALADGKYQQAHRQLSTTLASRTDAGELEARYTAMIAYGGSPVAVVQVMTEMEHWPAKQSGDVGWAYVAMAGDTFSEAVTVVVAREGDRLVIRDIEWGRP
jgi:diadenosine tetraphosphatase ApaH/serine/threonine PP2A family protein phosphatase